MLIFAPLAVLFASPAVAGMPDGTATWENLATKPVRIDCTEWQGEPWCKGTARVSAPVDSLAKSLEHMDQSAEVFEAVSAIHVLEAGTLHITLDFPGMISDRDYVAKYARNTDAEGVRHYTWIPVTHAKAPEVSGVVRLVDFAGEWTLVPDGESTLVTYLWQADLAGSFPSWALGIARKKTGNEALKDLTNAHGATLSAPE